MRIGVAVDNTFINDPRVKNEVKALVQLGHQVVVMCYEYDKAIERESFPGVEFATLRIAKKKAQILFALNNSLPFWKSMWANHIKDQVKNFDLEVLHLHDLYMAEPGMLAKKSSNIKLVLDLHEHFSADILDHQWTKKFPHRLIVGADVYGRKEGKLLAAMDRVITLSEEFADLLASKHQIDRTKFLVYPNVPDIAELSAMRTDLPQERMSDKSPILFYFGRISETRGIYTVLDALAILKKEYPKIAFVIAGLADKHEQDYFEQRIGQEDIREHVIHLGWQDISVLGSLVSKADICLCPLSKSPQHDSGVANKVYQYMYFSTPLLVSDCAPQRALIESTDCGAVHRNGDSEDFAKTLRTMLHSLDLEALGKNGKKAIETQYNLSNYSSVLGQVYEQIGNL